jgi:hypothetical protein
MPSFLVFLASFFTCSENPPSFSSLMVMPRMLSAMLSMLFAATAESTKAPTVSECHSAGGVL